MEILLGGVHNISSTHPLGQLQFIVVQISSNHRGSTQAGPYDGTDTNHAATNHHHHIDIGHFGTIDGMEAHAHRLDEGNLLLRESFGGDYLLPRHGIIFTHGTPALYAERLVVFTSIGPFAAARCTFAAVAVRIHGDQHAGFQHVGHFIAHGLNDCRHLMARHNGHLHHRVLSQKSAEIGAAEPHIIHLQEHFIALDLRFFQFYDGHFFEAGNLYCFHIFLFILTYS